MLTQCLECSAVFRVTTEQLRLAHGVVRCGACGRTFNALARLLDEERPAPVPVAAPDPAADEQYRLEPAQLDSQDHQILFTAPGSGDDIDDDENDEPAISVTALEDSVVGDEDVPLEIRDELREIVHAPAPQRSAWGWRLLAAVLVAALLVQAVWSGREAVFERFPQYRAVVTTWCERLGCTAQLLRAPERIELTARDVRDHPQFDDALLVNASLINRAKTVQAYPIIELKLFDKDGALIGARRFQPNEYLDDSIDIAAGMPPMRPVVVVLEILAQGRAAVSFEFAFL